MPSPGPSAAAQSQADKPIGWRAGRAEVETTIVRHGQGRPKAIATIAAAMGPAWSICKKKN